MRPSDRIWLLNPLSDGTLRATCCAGVDLNRAFRQVMV